MGKKKEKLGLGLRALISDIDNGGKKEEAVKEFSKTTTEVDIENIEANPFQPRTEFKEQELQELSESIAVHGVIQPITVRAIGGDRFQIISGERRWRASKRAGLTSIPAYVRIADDQGLLEMAIVENIQRSDLNAMEVAISFQRLIEECDLSHEQMAGRVNKNRSTITNYLRLLKLPVSIQKALKQELISMGHARALVAAEPVERQIEIFNKVVTNGLSVRATEQLVKDDIKKVPIGSKKSPETAEDIEIKKIKNRLIDRFETKVEIKRSAKGKGSFIIHFKSDREFNEILDLLDE